MSTELKIPDSTLWSAAAAVIGWALAVERRIFGRPTRKEIKEDLNEIKAHLAKQDEDARTHRERVANSLHSIGLKVAVLQTRANITPTGDTGEHKKL
jgi:hypothetical protein